MTQREVEDAPDVITSTSYLCNTFAHVLIDRGATNSFLFVVYARSLNKKLERNL